MIDLKQLSLIELGVLKDSLSEAAYKYPQLPNIPVLLKQVKRHLESDNRYVKGKQLYKKAKKNGLDDGYAEASDYYFAVYETEGESEVELILCLKFSWWMNGEAFNPRTDSHWARNFDSYDMPSEEKDDYADPGFYAASASEVIEWFTNAGMEEKPELLKFATEYREAVNNYRVQNYNR